MLRRTRAYSDPDAMKHLLNLLAAVALLVLSAAAAEAATIRGVVSDVSGAPVAGTRLQPTGGRCANRLQPCIFSVRTSSVAMSSRVSFGELALR